MGKVTVFFFEGLPVSCYLPSVSRSNFMSANILKTKRFLRLNLSRVILMLYYNGNIGYKNVFIKSWMSIAKRNWDVLKMY